MLKAQILMFNIWFSDKEFASAEFESGDIDGVDFIHESNRLGASLDSCDGAKNDIFVVRASDFGA